ncbi:replication initiation protein [Vibrio coralliilyticus]|uniref:Replication initiation protein n=1 Tax=Vibrio coralliilyticus TaxID=190893 RepID=A0AAP6ZNM7_9VIBR|nr:replication initiation protein [Vibrio coralliilyticus]NOJ25264.1 replication initiation protein [Vibrio coralliilyticus]
MTQAEESNKLSPVEGEYLPATNSVLADPKEDDSHLKSHSMVFSALDLTQKMQDMMGMMFTRMKEKDWEVDGKSPVYTWNIDELSKWFGVKKSQMAATLQKPSKALTECTAGFEDDNGDFAYKPLFKDVSYRKGTLTMIPNDRLKDQYLVNVSDKGFAKVDNKIFRALKNPNAKRLFDFISRFKAEYDLYPMSVERIQIYLGVISPKGKPLKKSYVNETEFITRLIKPALEHIAACPNISGKLELIEKDGLLGYELLPKSNGKLLIKFNVRWVNEPVDTKTRKDVLANVDKEMLLYREIVQRQGDGVPHLRNIRSLLISINEPTETIDRKIEEILQERMQNELDKEERELRELEQKVLGGLSDL